MTAGDTVIFNTIHANGRHGINNNNANVYPTIVLNNILTSNGGYGFVGASAAGLPADPDWDGNGYYNNTSGARNNADDTTTNPINGVSPYTNQYDVTLTGLPFNNAAGNDYSLNKAAGQGNAIRGKALPVTWLNGVPTAYPDMGAVQSRTDQAMFLDPGLNGGANA